MTSINKLEYILWEMRASNQEPENKHWQHIIELDTEQKHNWNKRTERKGPESCAGSCNAAEGQSEGNPHRHQEHHI